MFPAYQDTSPKTRCSIAGSGLSDESGSIRQDLRKSTWPSLMIYGTGGISGHR